MWICIAPCCDCDTPLRCSGVTRVLKGSHSFTCTPPTFICWQNEPYLPFPAQPKLVLIYRSWKDGRLSWPGWLATYHRDKCLAPGIEPGHGLTSLIETNALPLRQTASWLPGNWGQKEQPYIWPIRPFFSTNRCKDIQTYQHIVLQTSSLIDWNCFWSSRENSRMATTVSYLSTASWKQSMQYMSLITILYIDNL